MDIVEYLNEKNELEIMEKRLFEVINKIDKESYKLYSDVIDLDLNSFYKIDNLNIRTSNLIDVLEEIKNVYDYLIKLEESSLVFIKKEIIVRKTLIILFSSLTMFVNVYMGLANFIILNGIDDNSISEKIELICKKLETLDNLDLCTIGTTLENAVNFLKGKMNRLHAMKESEKISKDVIIANNYIGCYLSNDLSNEEIESLPLNYKQIIIRLLQKDLNSKSDDMYELLSELRNKNDSEIKLTKELN